VNPLTTALLYAEELGWPVFPRRGPVPLTKNGWKDASLNLDQISEWWTRWPRALIGVPTGKPSGIVVLDIDNKNGKNGFATLARLGKADLPDTPRVYTPHAGQHLYFHLNGYPIATSHDEQGLGSGLDVLSISGSVSVPTPGWGYAWDANLRPSRIPLLEAPNWLHKHKPERRRRPPERDFSGDPQPLLDRACDKIKNAGPGTRNAVINAQAWFVGHLVADGRLEKAGAEARLEAACQDMTYGGNLKKALYDMNRAFDAGRK
jgi:hypothetical protein